MKLIIAGDEDLEPSVGFIEGAIRLLKPYAINGPITEVVSRGTVGIDSEGTHWASHSDIKITHFVADWNKEGPDAGFIRDVEMAEYSDALLLIWNGVSRNSSSIKHEMKRWGKPIYEIIVLTT